MKKPDIERLRAAGWQVAPIWRAFVEGVIKEQPQGRIMLSNYRGEHVAFVVDNGQWEVGRMGVLPSLDDDTIVEGRPFELLAFGGDADLDVAIAQAHEALLRVAP